MITGINEGPSWSFFSHILTTLNQSLSGIIQKAIGDLSLEQSAQCDILVYQHLRTTSSPNRETPSLDAAREQVCAVGKWCSDPSDDLGPKRKELKERHQGKEHGSLVRTSQNSSLNEQWKKGPWLFTVLYIGCPVYGEYTTQFCGAYNKPV